MTNKNVTAVYEPNSLEGALRTRDALVRDIGELERQMRLAREQQNRQRRDDLQRALLAKQQWLREVKSWLRKHHGAERDLLLRCHKWISAVLQQEGDWLAKRDHAHDLNALGVRVDEGEMLLDAIERITGPIEKRGQDGT